MVLLHSWFLQQHVIRSTVIRVFGVARVIRATWTAELWIE
uniref:Uncharacterized protein n=1 Tax=Physcomitrium patens TaxID=3218 RepID=A0A2K1L9T0_PHYPA|nr:hypothetical protein PHYPA_001213 [Physcomitrium patens]